MYEFIRNVALLTVLLALGAAIFSMAMIFILDLFGIFDN